MAVATTLEQKKDLTLLHVAITLLLMFGISAIPPMGGITEIGMRVIAVFVAIIYAWCFSSLVWPCFLALAALPFTGIIEMKAILAGGWGTEAAVFMFLNFVIVNYLNEAGASRYIAFWLMTRSFISGKPWILSFVLLFAAFMISGFVHLFVGVFIIWGAIYSISKQLGYKPYDKYPTLMIIGVALMSCIGAASVPYAGTALILLSTFSQMTGLTIDMAHYLAYTMPCGLITIIAYLALCKFVFRADVSPLKNFHVSMIDQRELELNKHKKVALLTLGLFMFALLAPGLMPKDWLIVQWAGKIGIVGVAALTVLALSVIKIDNKNIFVFKDQVANIPWETMAMQFALIPLGSSLTAEATGITTFLSNALTPLFSNVSALWLFVLLAVITIPLTNFFVNFIIAMIFMPVAIALATPLGITEIQVGYFLIMIVQLALLTPAASAQASVLFGNKEWVQTKDIYKYAPVTLIVIGIILIFMSYWWLGVIG